MMGQGVYAAGKEMKAAGAETSEGNGRIEQPGVSTGCQLEHGSEGIKGEEVKVTEEEIYFRSEL